MNTPSTYISPTDRLEEYADIEMKQRSYSVGPMYLVLFFFVAWVTPIQSRFPHEVKLFGAFTTTLSLAVILLTHARNHLLLKKILIWRRLFSVSSCLAALNFGTFCAFTLVSLELSWTSLVVVLITLGICTGMVMALSPRFSLLTSYLLLMLVPPLIVNLLFIGGLRGNALSALFGAYLILLLSQGYSLNKNYQFNSRSRAKLQALIDEIPGMIAWVSTDSKFLGVNKNLADLSGKHPSEFIGKETQTAHPRTKLDSMTQELLKSESEQISWEITVPGQGKDRHYLMVARKTRNEREVIALGVEVSSLPSGSRTSL